MKFWKSIPKAVVLRQFIFVLVIFAILLPVAIWDSSTQVRSRFSDTSVSFISDEYTMNIPYELIASAELTALPDAGEKVENGFDNDILRAGVWTNSTWGEYHACIDLDAENCIVIHLTDGRTFVVSQANGKKTEDVYNKLLTHLTN